MKEIKKEPRDGSKIRSWVYFFLRTKYGRNGLNKKIKQNIFWQTEKRKVCDLIPCSYNPRKISEEQKTQLEKSLKKFNLVEIPAINLDNTLLAGHQRISVMMALGRGNESIDVRVPNRKLTKAEADEYMLRSNRNTGEWDFDLLKNFKFDLLNDIGFNSFELDNIFDMGCKEDDFNAQKEYDSIKTPTTKIGDVYQLGEHRLICGSSTDEKMYKKLLGDSKARLIFTDPPYNIDYTSPTGKKANLLNDKLNDDECLKFFISVLKNLYNFSTDDVSIYWWYANKNVVINRMAFESADWRFAQEIIWLKNSHVLSMGDYHKCYEPCQFGWKNKKKHFRNKKYTKFNDVLSLDIEKFQDVLDVWYQNRDNVNTYVHPTQKPVRLAERALKRNSDVNDIVLDGFGGSGSTLIACEQMKRKCMLIELDQKYCDVIVKRYEKFTGQKAKLVRS